MSKFAKGVATVSVLSASIFAATAAHAELTGNLGVTSNYMWRGVTQSGDDAAVSGGIDYATGGFYAGTWMSSLGDNAANYEIDFYLGYGGEAGSIAYDVGYIYYMYPVDDVESDFSELYASVGFGPVTAGIAYTVDTEWDSDNNNDLYYSLAGEFEVGTDLTVGALVGYYDFDDKAADDYSHVQLSLTKGLGDMGDITFAVDKAGDYDPSTDAEEDPRVSVAWSKGFDL